MWIIKVMRSMKHVAAKRTSAMTTRLTVKIQTKQINQDIASRINYSSLKISHKKLISWELSPMSFQSKYSVRVRFQPENVSAATWERFWYYLYAGNLSWADSFKLLQFYSPRYSFVLPMPWRSFVCKYFHLDHIAPLDIRNPASFAYKVFSKLEQISNSQVIWILKLSEVIDLTPL